MPTYDRVTRQGVRDLNARGYNGHRNYKETCRHHFGPLQTLGKREVYDADYCDYVTKTIWGSQCLWCKEIREER